MSLFAFRCWTEEFPRLDSNLVIFAGTSDFDTTAVLSVVSEQSKSSLFPEFLVIIAPHTARSMLDEISTDEKVFLAIRNDTIIGFYTYDAAGEVELYKSLQGEAPEKLPLDDYRRQGMTSLFIKRDGLAIASPTEHFVKPSLRNDTRFLRAAHALSDGAEILFVAFWLLPLLSNRSIRNIHLDTSAIASVAMAAILLKKNLEAVESSHPAVLTFKSYKGLEEHPFNFNSDEIVLISASQSGSLAASIIQYVKERSLIVTLFSLSNDVTNGTKVLCDLRYDDERNVLGIKPNEVEVEERSTTAIQLIGDHFAAASKPPRPIVPAAKDAPVIVKEYLSKLQGNGVFRTYRERYSGERRAVWVDINKLLKTTVFTDWMTKVVASKIPVGTRDIIYFGNDEGSKLVSDAILSEIQNQDASINVSTKRSLRDIEAPGAKACWKQSKSCALVVAGVTGHGAELLAASRALRDYAKDSHRVFLTTIVMTASKRSLTILESNLQFGHHKFEPMFALIVNRKGMIDSWEKEYLLYLDDEDELPEELKRRMFELRKASEGLENNLFLAGPEGVLGLRDNFAFWPNAKCKDASQADVFTTIATILENLRSGEGIDRERQLTNTTYDRSIISSETFARYNDGVIQAAFLRATYPVELNYQESPSESGAMASLIVRMADLANLPQGEAFSEFLLALALKRLLLLKNDMDYLKQELPKKNGMNDTQKWLIQKIVAV